MARTSKFLLPFIFVILSLINTSQCNLYGEQLRQFFKNIYSTPYDEHSVSRRNIQNLPGSGVFQEPSSRDLDVGFAVGVKDEGEAKDILINNHSSKTYSPTEYAEPPKPSAYIVQEPPSPSKELNIGVYVDPKNGVRYFTPGLIAGSPRQNYYEPLPGKSITQIVPGPGQLYSTSVANPQVPTPIPYQPAFTPYSLTSSGSNYGQRYLNPSSFISEPPYPYQISPPYTPFPTSEQHYPQNRILNSDRYQYPIYPNQNYYQQPLEFDSYSDKPYPPSPFQILERGSHLPFVTNVVDEDVYQDIYPGRFPRSHRRFPYRNGIPMRNFQNVFQIQEQVPRGSYGHFTQPVVMRQEPQLPEIIVDQRGTPVMTAQPYGERQVGAFKLKNDHGYQVTMNVPPIPADAPADGVLVMEMKANLYRPLS